MIRSKLSLLAGSALLLCAVGFSARVHSQRSEPPGPLVILDLPAPEIAGRSADWLNTYGEPVVFERGHVYAVHFWTFGCINCKRNLPAYTRWQVKYVKSPLTVIGVHTPETDVERDVKRVVSEVRNLGISYPVVIDGQSVNWRRWQQQVWPTVYLIDKRGHVRYYWVGELEWQGAGGTNIMEQCIDRLLNEPSPFDQHGDSR